MTTFTAAATRTALPLFTLLVALAPLACRSQPGRSAPAHEGAKPEAISLLGAPLYAPRLDSATRRRLEGDLAQAEQAWRANPNDPDALIWVGRRLGYLGRYTDAIAAFTEGVRRFPGDARMLRHRGHRYISVRRLDDAIADLKRAAELMAGRPDEVEPDGQPNARNIPIGSLHSNVWYHLALAHYLKWDWDASVAAARRGIGVSSNPDRLVSQTHWLYMALRRAGKDAEARAALEPIRDDFDIIENGSYYTLVKLYRSGITPAVMDSALRGGLANPTDLSLAYGFANWFLYSGDTARAVSAFDRIVNSSQWASFGYIAAEADLARLKR
jgi:tetratricopeptide (TPR) repeat protein